MSMSIMQYNYSPANIGVNIGGDAHPPPPLPPQQQSHQIVSPTSSSSSNSSLFSSFSSSAATTTTTSPVHLNINMAQPAGHVHSTSPSSSPVSLFDTLSISHGLSSSCSSLSSCTSTLSLESTDKTTSSLSNEFAVHLMLYNSIDVISRRYKDQDIYYKISAFDMNQMMDTNSSIAVNTSTTAPVALDEESMGIGDEYPFEIGIMSEHEHTFHPQEQFGRLLRLNEFVMMRAKMPMTEHIGIRVDLFRRTSALELPLGEGDFFYDKIAFCYIYPLDVKESNGMSTMPITSKSGKLVARFKAEYFIAHPYAGTTAEPHIKIKSKIRNPKSWQLKKNGFDIGHRGAGSARRVDQYEKVLENTVDSFNYAFKKGADMVELDVQLSKDKVPIVYHDFNVNIVLQKKDRDIETFEMNIKDLTFSQLQKLKLNPILHGREVYDFEEEAEKPHSQPFASFRTVLESVEPNCGFNVEIKYPQKKINGQWEAEKSHDLNEYVDLILQDLFSYGGERNIIISSFHPEICTLVKLKQERYPVLFLTQGLTSKWVKYENPLNHSIEMATYLALSVGLFGIAAHSEDIIKNRDLIQFVKSKGLILFCWGDDLNDRELIKNLKKAGVDGAIYDKIDLLVAKEDQIQHQQQQQQTSEAMEM